MFRNGGPGTVSRSVFALFQMAVVFDIPLSNHGKVVFSLIEDSPDFLCRFQLCFFRADSHVISLWTLNQIRTFLDYLKNDNRPSFLHLDFSHNVHRMNINSYMLSKAVNNLGRRAGSLFSNCFYMTLEDFHAIRQQPGFALLESEQ